MLVPVALFLAALLLRLVGIGWGMPNDSHNQTYHPDELVNYGISRQINLAHGEVTPGFYNYGTAYFIAESVADTVVAAYSGGGPTREQDIWRAAGRDILVGRILNALSGAGTVVVVWLILRRITTRFGSVFGSALIAIAPGFLVHSRFETVDVFATFWLGLSALFALRTLGPLSGSLAESDARASTDWRDALLSGLFAGISTGTKYTGILVLLVLWISLGISRRPLWWVRGVVGSVVCLAAFTLSTPGFLLDSDKFWRDVSFELGHSAGGHGLIFIGTPSGFVYHLVNLAVGLGMFATVAGVVALAFGSYRRHGWAIALLAFALAYYFVIGRAEVKFLRYTFPLLLPLAIGYGYAMGTAFRKKGRLGHALAVIGVFALSGNPLVLDFGGLIGAAQYTYAMVSEDPRDEAADSLKQIAANGSVGFVSDPWFYTPPLIPDAGLNRDKLSRIYDEINGAQHPRLMRYIPNGDFGSRVDWDVRLLTDSKPDYVVFSSFETVDLERLKDARGIDAGTQASVDRYKQFVAELLNRYRSPPTQFGGIGGLDVPIHDLMYVRPTIWFFKRNDLR